MTQLETKKHLFSYEYYKEILNTIKQSGKAYSFSEIIGGGGENLVSRN